MKAATERDKPIVWTEISDKLVVLILPVDIYKIVKYENQGYRLFGR